MALLSQLMARLGYVRLKDYGYALTPEGRIVEVERVVDDRFEPPPMSAVPFQSPLAMLPPAPPKAFPTPRPLPPAPDADEKVAPVPLFSITAALGSEAPGVQAIMNMDEIDVEEEEEEADGEEWEWKMAMARARAQSDAARPATDRAATARPAPIASRPKSPIDQARSAAPRTNPPRPAPRASDPPKTASRTELEKSVARVFSPPKPLRSAPTRTSAPSPAPAARIARGTEGPVRATATSARVRSPQLAKGSSRHPVVNPDGTPREVGDVTATDITAVDRAWQSMRDDEATRVNVVSADVVEAAMADDLPEESTTVDPRSNIARSPIAEGAAPLPRLSAKLRRTASPN